MSTTELGTYEDTVTGERYTVLRRTKSVGFNPVADSATKLKGSVDYITSCGIDLQQVGDDEAEFELIQIDGHIRRVS